MSKLLILLVASVCLAYCSQNGMFQIEASGKKIDVPIIIMVIAMSMFCGLRTDYNDTALYNAMFRVAPTLSEYLATDPGTMDNPLFYCLQSFYRHSVLDNHYSFNVVIAFFTIGSFVRFIKKYSTNFTFSIVLFFGLNLYMDTMGAMKQCLALAILTFAIEAMLQKRYVLFFIIVYIAMLVHAYAIFFVILPLFLNKPWTIVTYVTILGFAAVLLTFESSITVFLSAADSVGKHVAEEEIYDNTGINPLRVAVFAVPAMLSFLFQDKLSDLYDRKKNLFMNMSILSFLVMSLGIFMAANMFGRCAIYFELGSIVLLPWIIDEIFDQQSARFVSIMASICYLGFFLYDNSGFPGEYRAITLDYFFHTLSQSIGT